MGRLILCSGKRSAVPYTLKNTNLNIYSLEELCYYLYQNAATAEDFLYEDSLPSFIGTRLGMEELANKLSVLQMEKAALKDIAITLLCGTDLYTRGELEQFARTLDARAKLQSWQQQKQKADCYLQQHNYGDAAAVLEQLLMKEGELSGEALGDSYHNLGICKLHLSGIAQAAFYFAEAYERNHKEESLFAYLLTLRLAKKKNAYLSALDLYRVSEEQRDRLEQRLSECEAAARRSGEYQEIKYMKELIKEGKLAEYQNAAGELVNEWKNRYRKQTSCH